jgi:hypothetical protein
VRDSEADEAVPYACPVTARSLCLAAALAGTLALSISGCGGNGDDEATRPPPVAKSADFPRARGLTLAALKREVGAEGPVVAPAVSQLEPGTNRFGFGLFDRARAQIADAPVALYVARAGGGEARGPFPARYESLATKPQFRSRGVDEDPDSAQSVYVSDLRFRRPGTYELLAVVRLDDRLVAATPAGPPLKVVADSPVPEVGERPPRIHTPTKADVGGAIEEIDTRIPPGTMHDADLAEVVGKKPVVLLFATPALCQSRVCGPVVDIAEEVKAEVGDRAEFIHMEIYNENELEKGFRPQVQDWKLPTEPWLFTIDRDGKVAAAIEGAFSARELKQAIESATDE